MKLAFRYAKTTAMWVFAAMLIHALIGGGSFRGMALEQRALEGAIFAAAAAVYLGLGAAAVGAIVHRVRRAKRA